MLKRVAAMNDLSGLGHCSLSAAMSVLPVQGIQCCPIPTCVLSTQTDGYDQYTFHDLTQELDSYLDHWTALDEKFDAVSTGFLGGEAQLAAAVRLITTMKKTNGIALVDPIMGDDGALYSSVGEQMPDRMRRLISYADVATPNMTEACLLTKREYHSFFETEALEIARELSSFGPQQVVISGIFSDNQVSMACYDHGHTQYITRPSIPCSYPGSGDVFSYVLLGRLLNGKAFFDAVSDAADFISICIKNSAQHNAPRREGLVFEPYLKSLIS